MIKFYYEKNYWCFRIWSFRKRYFNRFFKEFSSIYVQDHLFEFNLLRIQGGLIDLKHNLYDNWSPIRSDAAIRRFHQLILRLGTQAKINNFKSIGLASGNNYNSFNDSFIDISEKFINKLIVLKGYKSWTFQSRWFIF